MRGVIIVHSDSIVSLKIKRLLIANGLLVYGNCSTGAEAARAIRKFGDGGVVVSGLRLSDMQATTLYEYLPENYSMLLLITPQQSGFYSPGGIVCLSTPINRQEFLETINFMISHHTGPAQKKREGVPIRGEQERRIIDSAKHLLMERNHMSEPEAHSLMQKKSMNSGKGLAEISKIILEGVY